MARSAAATTARIDLVSRSDRNRHAQLALANAVGGHGGPSPRTQAEHFAGGQEPDRFVDRQCRRGGRATQRERDRNLERRRINGVGCVDWLEYEIGKWSRDFRGDRIARAAIAAWRDAENRLASFRSSHYSRN